jgi:hypothetical protein
MSQLLNPLEVEVLNLLTENQTYVDESRSAVNDAYLDDFVLGDLSIKLLLVGH